VSLKRKGGRRFRTAVVDPDKLKWVRRQRCLCYATDPMGCSGPVVPHHEPPQRRSDDQTVPLCAWGHHKEGPRSRHVMGREKFETLHKLDLKAETAYYQRKYEAWKGAA
jgi:hypothetical protein